MGTKEEKVDHDYSIAGWDLSVIPGVREDVVERMTSVHCDAIRPVVTKLHEPPCTNKSKEIEGQPSVISCTCSSWSSRIFCTRQGPLMIGKMVDKHCVGNVSR